MLLLLTINYIWHINLIKNIIFDYWKSKFFKKILAPNNINSIHSSDFTTTSDTSDTPVIFNTNTPDTTSAISVTSNRISIITTTSTTTFGTTILTSKTVSTKTESTNSYPTNTKFSYHTTKLPIPFISTKIPITNSTLIPTSFLLSNFSINNYAPDSHSYLDLKSKTNLELKMFPIY